MFRCVTRRKAMFLGVIPLAFLGHELSKDKNFFTTSSVEREILGDRGFDSVRNSVETKTKALINDILSRLYDSSSKNKEKSCSPVASCDCSSGVERYLRDMPPAHYRFKIDSFSKFSDTLTHANEKYYTSQAFEVGGHKWKLSLYPKGDEERNGKGHLSMFLNVVDTEALPPGWEVNAIYRFFVLDQIRDKFLTIQDSLGKNCRFDAMKTESGIPQLLPLSEFEDSLNGFLVQDRCTFGAEISLICNTNAGERIMPVESFTPLTSSWLINPVSEFTEDCYLSQPFTAGDFKWELMFCPKGSGEAENNSISLFLKAVDLKPSDKLYVQYKLAVQGPSGVEHHFDGTSCFTAEDDIWGFREFLSLEEFNSLSNGYVVDDSTVIRVDITNMITIQSLS